MEGATDAGLAILRVFLGLLMVAHGSQKLFGLFGGYGIRGTGGYFTSIGYPAGTALAVIAGLTEAGGGAALAAGVLTPLAAAALIALFVNVAWAGHGHTFWNHDQPFGIEYPLVLGVVSATFAFTGPGRYSVDSALGWTISGPVWFVVAVAAGLLVGTAGLALRHRPEVAGSQQMAA